MGGSSTSPRRRGNADITPAQTAAFSGSIPQRTRRTRWQYPCGPTTQRFQAGQGATESGAQMLSCSIGMLPPWSTKRRREGGGGRGNGKAPHAENWCVSWSEPLCVTPL